MHQMPFYQCLYMFVGGWSNTTRLMDRAKIGGIIGLLLAASIDFGFYAMSTMFSNLAAIFVDLISYTVMSAIAGTIVAWVMAMGNK